MSPTVPAEKRRKAPLTRDEKRLLWNSGAPPTRNHPLRARQIVNQQVASASGSHAPGDEQVAVSTNILHFCSAFTDCRLGTVAVCDSSQNQMTNYRDTSEDGQPEIGPGFGSRIQKRPDSASNTTRPFRWFSSFRRSELTSFEQQASTSEQGARTQISQKTEQHKPSLVLFHNGKSGNSIGKKCAYARSSLPAAVLQSMNESSTRDAQRPRNP